MKPQAALAEHIQHYKRHNHGCEWRERRSVEAAIIRARLLMRSAGEALDMAQRLTERSK
jgi:hypothetical protein